MAWLLIILQILSAIPTIIKVIKDIIDLIKGLPHGERKAAQDELKSIIGGIKQAGISSEQATRLEALRERLRSRMKP